MITPHIPKLQLKTFLLQASQKLSSYFVDFQQIKKTFVKIYSHLSILSLYEHLFIHTYFYECYNIVA